MAGVIGGIIGSMKGLAVPAFTLSSASESRTQNTAMTGFTVSSTGGAIASFGISPAAPTGTTFNTSTGTFSGTPSVVAGATAFTITGTNASGSTTQTFTLTVTAPPFTATGGTVTTSGAYTIHTFTGNGTFAVSAGTKSVDVLVVAGGAGGYNDYVSVGQGIGAGGGAGGLSEFTTSVSVSSNAVVIGAGGAARNGGDDSSVLGTTVTGGLITNFSMTGGAAGTNGGAGGIGGSISQFNCDEDATWVFRNGGGGGGRGGAGGTGSLVLSYYTSCSEPMYVATGGVGGSAYNNSYSGSSVAYAKGGGGLAWQSDGLMAVSSPLQSAGQANRGDGGGSRFSNVVTPLEFTGGSGVVIVRYLT